jgi:hypothetical protein
MSNNENEDSGSAFSESCSESSSESGLIGEESDAGSSSSTSSSSDSSSSSSSSSDSEDLDAESTENGGQDGIPDDVLMLQRSLQEALSTLSEHKTPTTLRGTLVAPCIRRVMNFLKRHASDPPTGFNCCIAPCIRILRHPEVRSAEEMEVSDLETLPVEAAALRLGMLLEKAYRRIKVDQLQQSLDEIYSKWRDGSYLANPAQVFLEMALREDHRDELRDTALNLPQFVLRAWQVMSPTPDELKSVNLPLGFPATGLDAWLQKDYEAKVLDLSAWRQQRFVNKEKQSQEPLVQVKDRKRRR